MSNNVEQYLPYISHEYEEVPDNTPTSALGTQIGDIINTDEDVWHSALDKRVFRLTNANGNQFETNVFPILASIRESDTLPLNEVTNGSPFPNKVVMDDADPTIGTIYPSKYDRIYDAAGNAIYELVLCTGGAVDPKYQELINSGKLPTVTGNEVFSQCAIRAAAAWDPDATGEETWEERYGATYAQGIGSFAYAEPDGDVDLTAPLVSIAAEECAFPWKVDCVQWNESNDVLQVNLEFYNSADFELLRIDIYKKSGLTLGLRYSTDGGSSWTTIGTSGYAVITGEFTYVDRVFSFVSSRTTNTLDDFSIAIDLDDFQRVNFSSSASGSSYDVYAILRRGQVALPTNTSPYPDFPDKIVADLTGED